MDTITITDLEIWTHIGVPDKERSKEQRLLITVSLYLDSKKAAAEDNVEHSIDYDAVSRDIQMLAKTERKTIERFAEDTVNMIAQKYQALRIDVSVQKFIISGTKNVTLTISRP